MTEQLVAVATILSHASGNTTYVYRVETTSVDGYGYIAYTLRRHDALTMTREQWEVAESQPPLMWVSLVLEPYNSDPARDWGVPDRSGGDTADGTAG